MAVAYNTWSFGSLTSKSFGIERDLYLGLVAVVGNWLTNRTWIQLAVSTVLSVGGLALWRITRLLLWALARRPIMISGLLVRSAGLIGGCYKLVLVGHSSEDVAAQTGRILLTIVEYAVIAAIFLNVFRLATLKSVRTTTREGRRFILFGVVIVAAAIGSFLWFQGTYPDSVHPGELNEAGGMAIFVKDSNIGATLQVSPTIDPGSNQLLEAQVDIRVDFSNLDRSSDSVNVSTGEPWVLQLSGGWLATSLDTSDAKLVNNASVIPTSDSDSPVADRASLSLPSLDRASEDILPVSWIATGTKQEIVGTGDTEFKLTLAGRDLSRSGGTVSAVWPQLGCATELPQVLAEIYPGGVLPANVLSVASNRVVVPAQCDVILGGLTDTADLFPEFASPPLSLNGAIGWEQQDKTPSLVAAEPLC